jgi:hypothetical protein
MDTPAAAAAAIACAPGLSVTTVEDSGVPGDVEAATALDAPDVPEALPRLSWLVWAGELMGGTDMLAPVAIWRSAPNIQNGRKFGTQLTGHIEIRGFAFCPATREHCKQLIGLEKRLSRLYIW